jgi:hypothetical protein
MATTLGGSLTIDLTISTVDAATSTNLSSVKDKLATGSAQFPALLRELVTGTGADQASKQWYQLRTVTAGANDDLDLTALTGRKGEAINFSNVKWVVIALAAPATGVKLIFKGSTATNPWAAWKASATADEDIPDLMVRTSNKDGWATGGSNKVLRLNNPGGASVSYYIVLAG